ncbi:unnamed protein product [Ixodes hexagonus]
MRFHVPHWKPFRHRRVVISFTLLLAAPLLLLPVHLYESGVLEHWLESPYSEYTYPLEIDVDHLLRTLRAGRKPAYRALNHYERYVFKIPNERKCHLPGSPPSLLIVVKSAVDHMSRRDVIRKTWGQEGRFHDVDVRRVFMVGVKADKETALDAENAAHGDLVQADFIDSYWNVTIKTMLAFRWVLEHCSGVQWVFFVDDDFYVSTKNLIRFVQVSVNPTDRHLVGLVYEDTGPIRDHRNKWYVSLCEFPFSRYPPFAIAGAYVVSMPALFDLYQAARYTRQFRFDDVFLGILAKKIDLRPLHSDLFREKKHPTKPEDFVGLVAAHGFHDSVLLVRVWERERRLGNA